MFEPSNQAVGALLNARISLLELCHDANTLIQDSAIDLVKELFSMTDLDQVHDLQESAREYGALLYVLSMALSDPVSAVACIAQGSSDCWANSRTMQRPSTSSKDGRLSTPTSASPTSLSLQQKCIDLVEIFCAGNTRTKKAMCRIFPVELFIPAENRAELIARHTASSTLARAARTNRSMPHFSFDFESISSDTRRSRVMSVATNVKHIGNGAFDRWLNDARSQGEHWRNIIESVLDVHERPELVWRDAMQAELREALNSEIDHLEMTRRQLDTTSGTVLRWDHEMFYVNYQSYDAELIVNGYFIECLIPKLNNMADSFEVSDPVVLAWHLSDRLSVETNQRWRIQCVRCLRLILRRYAMTFHGQLPVHNVLSALANHAQESPVFLREVFQLLNTAIVTTRNAPSDNFNRLSTTLVRAVVDVLSDPVFVANLSANHESGSDTEDEESDEEDDADSEEAQIFVKNANDAVVRTGITVLLSITTRSKFTLLLVRPKRMFICRLLALETLDHVTISRILVLLKKVSALDESRTSSFSMPNKHNSSASKLPVDGNWKSLALVYVLFASCDPKGMGMCIAAAEFLKENFATLSSNSASRPISNGNGSTTTTSSVKPHTNAPSEFSRLLTEAMGFAGRGMGRLLETSTPQNFSEIFNAHEKRAADVNWGRRHRLRLYRYLKSKYIASTEQQSASHYKEHYSTYPIELIDGDHFADEEDIFVGNIFLRSYIEGDGEFLTEWTPEMYGELIGALFTRLSDLGRAKSVSAENEVNVVGPSSLRGLYAEPWEVQVLILKALARLIPSRCTDLEIKSEYYEALLAPMKRTLLGEADQIRGILALEIVLAILSSPSGKDVTNANIATCINFLDEKGLAVLGEALERMLHPSYQELLKSVSRGIHNMARVLLYRVTDTIGALALLSSGVVAIKRNPSVVTALLELSSRQTIMKYSEDAATVCMSCLSNLCHSDELRSLIVGAGGLLFLLDTCAFCPAEETIQPPDSSRLGNQDADARGETTEPKASRFIGAVRSAALALRSCLESDDTSLAYQVLKQLLTPSFIRVSQLLSCAMCSLVVGR